MRIFFHNDQLKHDPKHEILGGRVVDYMETPSRALSVLAACASCRSDGSALGTVTQPDDNGMQPILAVHSAEFVEHSKTRNAPPPLPPSPRTHAFAVYARWVAEGGNPDGALPECWPARCFHKFTPSVGGKIAGNSACNVAAACGHFCYDMSCVVTQDTWGAVYWSGVFPASRHRLHVASRLLTRLQLKPLFPPPSSCSSTKGRRVPPSLSAALPDITVTRT
jgi:hypothetical protein